MKTDHWFYELFQSAPDPDGRFVLWGLVPEAQNRALRVVTLDDRETVHNAFFDRGFLKALTRSQPSLPAEKPAP